MLAINWSTNLWKNEMGEPTNTSIAAISSYYRCNVSDLNNLIGSSFRLNNVVGSLNYLELIDSSNSLIDDEAASIYKYLYLMSYYNRLITVFTGVGDVNILIEADSDNGTLRFADRGNLAKLYIQLRKDTENTLRGLVNKYKMRNQTAVDITGDDIYVSVNNNGFPFGEPGVLYERDVI